MIVRCATLLSAIAVLAAVAAPPATAASLTRSVVVAAPPAEVWARVGPFCAIAQWHPAIGSCADDRATPPTRTLVTRDGAATFVERQTARSEPGRYYSYAFTQAPVPVTHYVSTIRVMGKGDGTSIVTWSSTFTPDPGKAAEANDALSGIYETGLAAIKAMFGS
jgi:uncharacterized protein YndB with AHSA1/START domain